MWNFTLNNVLVKPVWRYIVLFITMSYYFSNFAFDQFNVLSVNKTIQL